MMWVGVRRLLLAAVAGLALVVAGCSDGQVERGGNDSQQGYVSADGVVYTVPVAERKPAPEFGGPLLDGGEFSLADAKGDVVVLNVWGSWCPPCRKEAPGLQAVYEKYQKDGVQFVGVNTRDTETGAQAYEDEFGITFPSVVDSKGQELLAFRDTLPPAAIPSTIVIDRDGQIAARVLGPLSEQSLGQLVGDIVKGPSRQPSSSTMRSRSMNEGEGETVSSAS